MTHQIGTAEFFNVEEMTLIEFKDTFIFEPLKPAGIQQHLVLHRTTHVFFLCGMTERCDGWIWIVQFVLFVAFLYCC
jgi:hypothetical protein